MVKEEFVDKVHKLRQEDEDLQNKQSEITKRISANHKELRELYQEYIDEHFPYKVGDELIYEFVNSDGDLVSRRIIITEINGYMCNLSEINLYYTYNTYNPFIEEPKTADGRISYVKIDGTIGNFGSAKLRKI